MASFILNGKGNKKGVMAQRYSSATAQRRKGTMAQRNKRSIL